MDAGTGGSDPGGGGDDVGGEPEARTLEVAVAGSVQWTDTGIDLAVGEHVRVSATGSVALPGGPAGPSGVSSAELAASSIVRCAGHGGLLARVGPLGEPFAVGASTTFAATNADRLWFGVNDLGPEDNGGAFEVTVTAGLRYREIDSGTVSVAGTVAWTDTGIDLAGGHQLTITASGTVLHHVDGMDGCDPAGEPNTPDHGASLLGCPDHAALLGRIGESGSPFPVGRQVSMPVGASGRIHLGINDIDLANNGGAFSARIAVTAPAP